jgi:hypothetical protein
MKKIYVFSIACLCLLCTFISDSLATNYLWTGATSNAWNTATNWSPNGVPAEADSVTIVSAPNNPQMTGNRGVHRLELASGELNLGSDSLTVYGSSVFTSGQILNGQLNLHGTAVFQGAQISTGIYAVCSIIELNGSSFSQEVNFEVSTSCTSIGGNTLMEPLLLLSQEMAALSR